MSLNPHIIIFRFMIYYLNFITAQCGHNICRTIYVENCLLAVFTPEISAPCTTFFKWLLNNQIIIKFVSICHIFYLSFIIISLNSLKQFYFLIIMTRLLLSSKVGVTKCGHKSRDY